jgi:fermentation-respiration switch protein FrsA (DUF1100 family)
MLTKHIQRVFYIGLATVVAHAQAQDVSPVNLWEGVAITSTERTRLQLDISRADDDWQAHLSLLDIGVRGWPAESVLVTGDRLTIVVRADSGPQKMQLTFANGRLVGTWQAPGFDEDATITLTRAPVATARAETRLLVDGPAGKLGASLIMPAGSGPYPAVVFTHGSGPQPRDASRWAAMALAEYGIASIIYDKRGVGESEGSFDGASLKALAGDAIAVAEYLSALTEIEAVGFAGHSQGGWVGPLAGSTWAHTAFVISSAGPAVPPSRESQWTVIRAMRANGASETEQEAARHLFDLWHAGLRSADWSAFDAAIDQVRHADWFEPSGISWLEQKPGANDELTYRAMMDYDPLPALKLLSAPLLAILSPQDESIDAMETADILRGLRDAGRNITVRIYDGYNHGMRRLGVDAEEIRWPSLPDNYYRDQAVFIERAVVTQ